jgi:mycothiol S-conjugate amidase
MTTYNAYGGYGHPDHIRTHDVAVRAFERAGDPAWYPEQFEEPGMEPWTPSKLYEQAIPASVRDRMSERMKELGRKSFWSPPDDATPEQIAEMEASAAKMLVPDESITTWIDISGAPLEAKWKAIHEHVTQISDESPFMLLGFEGWRDSWANESYILCETRIQSPTPETDLFAGIV